MNKALKLIAFSITIALSMVLSACGPSANQTPTTDPAAVYTQVAATVQAGILQTQASMPTSTSAPTNTPQPTPTATQNKTPVGLTPIPTLTQYIPNAGNSTASTGNGDDLKWVADISVPDCTVFGPGEEFTKTWKVKNTGTTTWTADYYLLWTSITNFDPNNYKKVVLQPVKKLGGEVKPGEEVELDVNLLTPESNGKYKIFFIMMNPNVKYPQTKIGFGEALWTLIVVNDPLSTPVACP
jgi:hypothetical protein